MACCNNQCQCCPRKTTCNNCRTQAVSGCHGKNCDWYPLEETATCERPMRICCDQNGCCGMFPQDCRNSFWPDFAHPRWLCCKDLYCARRKNCC